MRYLNEFEPTQVGEIRQGSDGQLYQWVEGIDGLGNPIGFWNILKRLVRQALPIAQKIAPFVPGGAAALTAVTPILQEAGLVGGNGLGALYEAPDGSLYQVQGLAQDEELHGLADEELMGLGYAGEVRQDLEGNLYQWVEGIDGLGNPAGCWQCCYPRRARRCSSGAMPRRPRPRFLRRRPMRRPAGFYGPDLAAEEAELQGLGAEEELQGFAHDDMEGLAEEEELRGMAADEELMGLADEELQGFAEEELQGLAEEELQGLDQEYVLEPGMNGLEAYVPAEPTCTPWFTPPAQAPRKRTLLWDPLW